MHHAPRILGIPLCQHRSQLVVECRNSFWRKACPDPGACAYLPAPGRRAYRSRRGRRKTFRYLQRPPSPCRAATADRFPVRRRISISDYVSRLVFPSPRSGCRAAQSSRNARSPACPPASTPAAPPPPRADDRTNASIVPPSRDQTPPPPAAYPPRPRSRTARRRPRLDPAPPPAPSAAPIDRVR